MKFLMSLLFCGMFCTHLAWADGEETGDPRGENASAATQAASQECEGDCPPNPHGNTDPINENANTASHRAKTLTGSGNPGNNSKTTK